MLQGAVSFFHTVSGLALTSTDSSVFLGVGQCAWALVATRLANKVASSVMLIFIRFSFSLSDVAGWLNKAVCI